MFLGFTDSDSDLMAFENADWDIHSHVFLKIIEPSRRKSHEIIVTDLLVNLLQFRAKAGRISNIKLVLLSVSVNSPISRSWIQKEAKNMFLNPRPSDPLQGVLMISNGKSEHLSFLKILFVQLEKSNK